MAIVVVGSLDEGEGALRTIKEQIERRGHKSISIDVSIGTGAITSSSRPNVGCVEVIRLGGGTLQQVKEMLAKERDMGTTVLEALMESFEKRG